MSSFFSRFLKKGPSSSTPDAPANEPTVDDILNSESALDAPDDAQPSSTSNSRKETSEINAYSQFNDTVKKEGPPVTFVINKDLEETSPEKYGAPYFSEDMYMTALIGSQRRNDHFNPRLLSPGIGQNQPETHGLLGIAYKCYNAHIPLVISPDDVWIAIMTQFSFWMKDNAQLVRSHFVSTPNGKQTLKVELDEANAEQFSYMVSNFEASCHDNILDKEFAAWANPTFSTTTQVEKTVYAGILMASLSEYFSYVAVSRCGIPRVVVRGNREDWENILLRVEKLKSDFGLKSWGNQLAHVVEKIIQTVDGKGDASFWNKIISRKSRGSGKSYFSGWITAFNRYSHKDGKEVGTVKLLGGGYKDFPVIDSFQMTNGFAEVDVKVENPVGQKLFDAKMILGIVGMNHDKENNAIAVGRGWGWGSVEGGATSS